jgi:hypothetical protein
MSVVILKRMPNILKRIFDREPSTTWKSNSAFLFVQKQKLYNIEKEESNGIFLNNCLRIWMS